MKKNLFVWQIVGVTFTAVLGTLFHFLYQWIHFKIIASFSAVNESTWEHMKLLFIPSLLFAFIQSFYAKNDFKAYWVVKLIGIIVGTLLIPILFYTLSGTFGRLPAIINIAIFFISVFSQYLIEFFLFNRFKFNYYAKCVSILVLVIILVLFVVFSYYPPRIPLFLDPLTNSYGVYG